VPGADGLFLLLALVARLEVLRARLLGGELLVGLEEAVAVLVRAVDRQLGDVVDRPGSTQVRIAPRGPPRLEIGRNWRHYGEVRRSVLRDGGKVGEPGGKHNTGREQYVAVSHGDAPPLAPRLRARRATRAP